MAWWVVVIVIVAATLFGFLVLRAIRSTAGKEPGLVADPSRYAPQRTESEERP